MSQYRAPDRQKQRRAVQDRLDRTIERLGPAWEAFDQSDPSESGEPFWLRMRELEISHQHDEEEAREDRTHHLALKAYRASEMFKPVVELADKVRATLMDLGMVVVDCHGERR